MDRIEEIIKIEWEFFDKTKNLGGRAECQEDWETFQIMRGSQFQCWNQELRESYYQDLLEAKQMGRNLITEKYGRMMESTDHEEYEKIKQYFPKLSKERMEITEQIIAIQVKWLEEFGEKYPKLSDKARKIHTFEDTSLETSAETYLRGELGTYSDETLVLYGRYIVKLMQENKNITEMIHEKVVQKYGFSSLEEAEEKGR